MALSQFGIVGLGPMGRSLALNVASKGFAVAVYNRPEEDLAGPFLAGPAKGKAIAGAATLEALARSLDRPRKVLVMVKAGAPVDDCIAGLRPFLEPGDVVIDGGNSHFRDTERRLAGLDADGILYLGAGISGGEAGALAGPSIMPGGSKEAYEAAGPILRKIAAQVDDGPCCAYMGPRGAGHYVKMVHNGIEYGMMQLIAEVYWLCVNALGMEPAGIADLFSGWAAEELGGYLMEITSAILRREDPDTARPIVEVILDRAGQKGTGKWTSQSALDVGCPVPTIDAAVSARILSAYRDERAAAANVLSGPRPKIDADEDAREAARDDLRKALYGSMIADYAQGMALLRAASNEHGYGLDLAAVARVWKGGCIVRSKLLGPIREAFAAQPGLPNLMTAGLFAGVLGGIERAWRNAVARAAEWGLPAPALAASLAYYDGYRSERLPANLTQAQRDFFGAHTYERVDRPGAFHTDWEEHG